MKFNITPSDSATSGSATAIAPLAHRRDALRQDLIDARRATLAIFEGMDAATFCCHAHPDFSPAGWHLGHIGFTEALWLLEPRGVGDFLTPERRRLYAADGLPKAARAQLPTLAQTVDFLEAVRQATLEALERVSLENEERLWRWLLQHEAQHSETIRIVLQIQRWPESAPPLAKGDRTVPPSEDMVAIPGGSFEMGSGAIAAIDNERPSHRVQVEPYWLDRAPVTVAQYRHFIAAGGYETERWWHPEGWAWRQAAQIRRPRYWSNDPCWDDHPVCGVSWYEADAYARFAHKRLPTEAEWERAARWQAFSQSGEAGPLYPWGEAQPAPQHANFQGYQGQTTPVGTYPASGAGCHDLLGNVWEWTNTWFAPYAGFEAYPYRGYSQAYFDQQHRVLRGGSWATPRWTLRSSFRNWYHPSVREIFAGFRCARDPSPQRK